MKRGSACVEAFRDVAHTVARYFGDPDRSRKSKEAAFHNDIRVLVEDMEKKKLHTLVPNDDTRWIPVPHKNKKDTADPTSRKSAITDVFVEGSAIWQAHWDDFITSTCYDPSLGGYPVVATDQAGGESNPLQVDSLSDVHGGTSEENEPAYAALGGGDVFSGGSEE